MHPYTSKHTIKKRGAYHTKSGNTPQEEKGNITIYIQVPYLGQAVNYIHDLFTQLIGSFHS